MEQYFQNRASVDDEPVLAHNRRANDARLKSRFEHIFWKYGRDFEGVGDEIDLETGEVHVNNGHLENMRHEVDPGEVLRMFGDSLDKSAGPGRGGQFVGETLPEDDADSSGSGYSSGGSAASDNENEFRGTQQHAPDELPSGMYPERTDMPPAVHQPRSTSRAHRSVTDRNGHQGPSGNRPLIHSRAETSNSMPFNLPLLQGSMDAMQTKRGTRRSIDPNDIQELGLSIANQLAQFMSRASKDKSKSRKHRSHNTDASRRWEYPRLPGDRRSRTPSPPRAAPPISSAAMFDTSPGGQESIWAPLRHTRPHKRRRSDRVEHTGVVEAVEAVETDGNEDHAEPMQSEPTYHRPTQTGDRHIAGPRKKMCYNCGETKTTVFRKGPHGRLCNPCGLYYYRYEKMRPVVRPSSSQEQDKDEFEIPVTPSSGVLSRYTANTGRVNTDRKQRTPFTTEEEELIVRLREVDQMSWSAVARLLNNRSGAAVSRHYKQYLLLSGSGASQPSMEESSPLGRTLMIQNERMNGSDAPTPQNRPHQLSKEIRPTSSGAEELGVLDPALRLWDEENSSLEEMPDHLIERDEEGVQQRHDDLRSHERRPEQSISAGADISSRPEGGSEVDQGEYNDRIRMPPPALRGQSSRQHPNATLRTSDPGHLKARALDEASRVAPEPQTPLVPTPTRQDPPRPPQVGASAWSKTQPASKGNLPFQPARKRFAPISVQEPVDPSAEQLVSDEQLMDGPTDDISHHHIANGHPHASSTASHLSPSEMELTGQDQDSLSLVQSLSPVEHGGVPASETSRRSGRLIRKNGNGQATRETEVLNVGVIPDGNITISQTEPTKDRDDSFGFTQEQDEFIKNAHEKQGLLWATIAAMLPGDGQKSSQSVIDRYYGHIDDKAPKQTPKKATPKIPTMKPGYEGSAYARYTDEESQKVIRLREEEGLTWKEMAPHFPYRTAISLRNHYHLDPTRRDKQCKVQSPAGAAKRPRHSMPLLRQAVRNSSRRASNDDAVGRPPFNLPETPHPPVAKTTRPERGSQDLAETTGAFRPSEVPMAEGSDKEIPNLDSDWSTSVGSAQRMPSEKDESASRSPSPPESAPESFLSTVASLPHPSAARSKQSAQVSYPDFATELTAAAGSRQPLVQEGNENMGHSSHMSEDPDQTAVVSATGSKKRKRPSGSSKRISEFEVVDSDSDDRSEPERGAEEEKAEVDRPPRPATRRQRGYNSATGFEATPGEITSPSLENPPQDSLSSNASDRAMSGASQPQSDDFQTPKKTLVSPDEWTEAISLALKSAPDQRMRCRGIIAWIRDQNDYHLDSTGAWTQRLRYNLKRNPSFHQVDPDNPYMSPWTFTNASTNPHPAIEVVAAQTSRERNSPGQDDDAPSSSAQSPSLSSQPKATATTPNPTLLALNSQNTSTPANPQTNLGTRTNASPSPPGQHSFIRRPQTHGQHRFHTPSLRHSDPSLIKRATTAIMTPFRRRNSTSNTIARSGTPKRFEPLRQGTPSRGTPAASTTYASPCGPWSARRVVQTRGVDWDEDDEERDELS